MKFLPSRGPLAVWMALFLLSIGGSLPGQEKKSALQGFQVDFLRVETETRVKAIEKPLADLNALYRTQLQKLEEKVAGSGKLERVLAVQKEAEGFESAWTPEAGNEFPELRVIQRVYRAERKKRAAAEQERLVALYEAYSKKLGNLQETLTKERKIEEAVRARDEKERVSALLQAMREGEDLSEATARRPPGMENLAGKEGRLRAWGVLDKSEGRRIEEVAENHVRRIRDFVSISVGSNATWVGIRSDGRALGFDKQELGERGKRLKKVMFWREKCMLYEDGTVFVEEGGYEIPEVIRDQLVDVVDIDFKTGGALALRKDETILVWGSNYGGSGMDKVPGEVLKEVVQIDVGATDTSHVLKADGTVITWKHPSSGNVHRVPTTDSLKDIVKIAAGNDPGSYLIALDSEGRLHTRGSNNLGARNVPEDLGKCRDILTDGGVCVATQEDGTLVAWGRNDKGLVDFLNELGTAKDLAIVGQQQLAFWIE